MNLKKDGLIKIKKLISLKDLDIIEREYINFIGLFCKKKNKKIHRECTTILKNKNFRIKALRLLEKIESEDKNLFYNLSKDFGYTMLFEKIIASKKIKKIFSNYFMKSLPLVQKKDPIMIFNKKKLERLNYDWHQESQFYPNHKYGLHIWFPLFRSCEAINDGGISFAEKSNKKNYPFKKVEKKNSWRQKIPLIDVDKKFKIINLGANRGDVIIFENKIMHKSACQLNDLPRVAVVIRFLSNSNNEFVKIEN